MNYFDLVHYETENGQIRGLILTSERSAVAFEFPNAASFDSFKRQLNKFA